MPLFSHYGDIPDISQRLSYPSLVFAIVTPIVVLARLSTRRVSGKVGADDWVILVSCMFAETLSIQMIVLCGWAFGKHYNDVQRERVIKSLRLYFIAQILYKLNICLTKISILLLYIRLFIRPGFLLLCWLTLSIIVTFTLATTIASIFQCSPVAYAFDKSVPGGKCINLTAFWYAMAAFNIVTDVVIILLPVPVIVGLHLPKRTKGGLCAIFAVGVFVCITSILRTKTLSIATSYSDTTWNSIPSSMWTVIESNIGVICACLPALRKPLLFAFSSTRSLSRLYGGENIAGAGAGMAEGGGGGGGGGAGIEREGGGGGGGGGGPRQRRQENAFDNMATSEYARRKNNNNKNKNKNKNRIYEHECECECDQDWAFCDCDCGLDLEVELELERERQQQRQRRQQQARENRFMMSRSRSGGGFAAKKKKENQNSSRSRSRLGLGSALGLGLGFGMSSCPSTTRSLSGLSRLNIKQKPMPGGGGGGGGGGRETSTTIHCYNHGHGHGHNHNDYAEEEDEGEEEEEEEDTWTRATTPTPTPTPNWVDPTSASASTLTSASASISASASASAATRSGSRNRHRHRHHRHHNNQHQHHGQQQQHNDDAGPRRNTSNASTVSSHDPEVEVGEGEIRKTTRVVVKYGARRDGQGERERERGGEEGGLGLGGGLGRGVAGLSWGGGSGGEAAEGGGGGMVTSVSSRGIGNVCSESRGNL